MVYKEVLTNESEYNDLVKYAKQDVICLYNAINNAITFYNDNFKVNPIQSLSTASLSYKIFKKEQIHSFLTQIDDDLVIKGYFPLAPGGGGYRNHFKFKGNNLKYYDVNSLYPHVMLNDIPYEIISTFNTVEINGMKYHKVFLNKPINREMEEELFTLTQVKLENFFGFARCQITNPTYLEILPFKNKEGYTYYPANGSTWIGTYFSEELKFVQSIGFKIELLEGIEFSKFKPFNDYISKFYNLKLESEKIGDKTMRSIAKLHLNSLYGYFGKDYSQNSLNINENIVRNSKRSIHLNDNLFINIVEENIKSRSSNVAIAAAVTSYARIHMYNFIIKYYLIFIIWIRIRALLTLI